MERVRNRIKTIVVGVTLGWWLAGCQTSAPRTSAQGPSTLPSSRIGEVERADELAVEIVTVGGTGTVVVNRRPVGLAPQTIHLPVTAQGFLAEQVIVAVRFVARDVTESSMTVDIVLEPTDRAPPRIEFSRDGARRIFKTTETP